MQLPVQVTFHGMPHSAALEDAIRERSARLERRHPQLISSPGAEIAINRDHSEDPFVAMRDAFDAARRKLNALARRESGAAKRRLSDLRRGRTNGIS